MPTLVFGKRFPPSSHTHARFFLRTARADRLTSRRADEADGTSKKGARGRSSGRFCDAVHVQRANATRRGPKTEDARAEVGSGRAPRRTSAHEHVYEQRVVNSYTRRNTARGFQSRRSGGWGVSAGNRRRRRHTGERYGQTTRVSTTR